MRHRLTALILGLCLSSTAAAQSSPADLTLTQIQPNSTFSNPLAIRHAGDDSGRIFIVQKGGTIRVFDTRASTLLAARRRSPSFKPPQGRPPWPTPAPGVK